MIYRVGYLRDVLGNNYIGLKFNESELSPFLSDLYEIVDDDDRYDLLVSNQRKRDMRNGHTHHSTIISVMAFNKLSESMGSEFQERIDVIFSLEITDLIFEGVGTTERAGSQTYFVVLNSPTLDEIRSSLGLPSIDFHITIGFNPKDVFGMKKSEVFEKKSKLSKLVDVQYSIHDGSHEWVHDVANIDDNLKRVPGDKIEILNMTDTIITYKLDHTQIQIGIINDDLYVVTMCEYTDD